MDSNCRICIKLIPFAHTCHIFFLRVSHTCHILYTYCNPKRLVPFQTYSPITSIRACLVSEIFWIRLL